jgi:uncharacterized membrane protein YadS
MEKEKISEIDITPQQLKLLERAITLSGEKISLGEITRVGNSFIQLVVPESMSARLASSLRSLQQMIGFDDNHELNEEGRVLKRLIEKL